MVDIADTCDDGEFCNGEETCIPYTGHWEVWDPCGNNGCTFNVGGGDCPDWVDCDCSESGKLWGETELNWVWDEDYESQGEAPECADQTDPVCTDPNYTFCNEYTDTCDAIDCNDSVDFCLGEGWAEWVNGSWVCQYSGNPCEFPTPCCDSAGVCEAMEVPLDIIYYPPAAYESLEALDDPGAVPVDLNEDCDAGTTEIPLVFKWSSDLLQDQVVYDLIVTNESGDGQEVFTRRLVHPFDVEPGEAHYDITVEDATGDGIDETVISYTIPYGPSTFRMGQTYSWFVTAYYTTANKECAGCDVENGSFCMTYTIGDIRYFRTSTKCCPPTDPADYNPVLPQDSASYNPSGSSVVDIESDGILLTWSGNATFHDVFLGPASGSLRWMGTVESSGWGTVFRDVSYRIPADELLHDTTYNWQIKAQTLWCETDYTPVVDSPVMTFTTSNVMSGDCLDPEYPTKPSGSHLPDGRSDVSSGEVVFSWGPCADSGDDSCVRADYYHLLVWHVNDPMPELTGTEDKIRPHDDQSLLIWPENGKPMDGFEPSEAYAWRVFAVKSAGADCETAITPGEIWRFTTCPQTPVVFPDNPIPADGAGNVSIDSPLGWSGSAHAEIFLIPYTTDTEEYDPLKFPVSALQSSGSLDDIKHYLVNWISGKQYWPCDEEITWWVKTGVYDDCGVLTYPDNGVGGPWTFTTEEGDSNTAVPPTAPTLHSPEDGAADVAFTGSGTIQLSWYATGLKSEVRMRVNGTSQWYEVYQVGTSPGNTEPYSCTVSSINGENLVLSGTYDWSVRCANICGEDVEWGEGNTNSFTIDSVCTPPDIPPVPVLIYPTRNATVAPQAADFRWRFVDDGLFDGAYLLLRPEGAFSELEVPLGDHARTGIRLELEENKQYEWAVRTRIGGCYEDQGQVLTNQTSWRSFSTCAAIPEPFVTNVVPVDGASGVPAIDRLTLEWEELYTVSAYRLYFGSREDGLGTMGRIFPYCDDLDGDGALECTWDVPSDLYELGTEYSWQLAPTIIDTCGNPVDVTTDVYRFRTMPDCNGNGQSDILDVTLDPDSDDDGDWIPDECNVCHNGSVTYTSSNDFEENGFATNAIVVGDELSLPEDGSVIPASGEFLWVTLRDRGTVVLIDPEGSEPTVVGEYRTSPETTPSRPIRVAVDDDGSVWVANSTIGSSIDGQPLGTGYGSIVKVGVVMGGTYSSTEGAYTSWSSTTCVDRNGDGMIQTSSGLCDIRDWVDSEIDDETASKDAWGSYSNDTSPVVQHADDECILLYQRTPARYVTHLSYDPREGHADDLWVGGLSGPYTGSDPTFVKVDGSTGEVDSDSQVSFECGGFGGVVDSEGILWSASGQTREDSGGGNRLLVYDTNSDVAQYWTVAEDSSAYTYNLTKAPQSDGSDHVWCSLSGSSMVYELSYNSISGTVQQISSVEIGSQRFNRGLDVRMDDTSLEDLWVASGEETACPTQDGTGGIGGNMIPIDPSVQIEWDDGDDVTLVVFLTNPDDWQTSPDDDGGGDGLPGGVSTDPSVIQLDPIQTSEVGALWQYDFSSTTTDSRPIGYYPSGVAVDCQGGVWVPDYCSDSITRYLPGSEGSHQIDLSGHRSDEDCSSAVGDPCCDNRVLCEQAGPFTLGDMTTCIIPAVAPPGEDPTGSWSAVYDSQVFGNQWESISFNSETECSGETPPVITVRVSDTIAGLGSADVISIETSGQLLSELIGRYLQVDADFDIVNDASDVLCDLTIVSDLETSTFSAVVLANTPQTYSDDSFSDCLDRTSEPFSAAVCAMAGDWAVADDSHLSSILDELMTYLKNHGYSGQLYGAAGELGVGVAFYGTGPNNQNQINAGLQILDPNGVEFTLHHYGECDSANSTSLSAVLGAAVRVDAWNSTMVTLGCVADADCNDGHPCTTDTCNSGVCHFETTICLDDGDECTIDSCDPYDGGCASRPVDCSDSYESTDDSCVPNDPGPGYTCQNVVNCDDGNPCTIDAFDPATDTCDFSDPVDCVAYFEQNGIDIGFCSGDVYCDPTYVPPDPENCDDLNVACTNCMYEGMYSGDPCVDIGLICFDGDIEEQTPAGCVECTTHAHCADDSFCNGVEQCVGYHCVPGIPFPEGDCDDDTETLNYARLELVWSDSGAYQHYVGTPADSTVDLTILLTNFYDTTLELDSLVFFVRAVSALETSETFVINNVTWNSSLINGWADLTSVYGAIPSSYWEFTSNAPGSVATLGGMQYPKSGTDPAISISNGSSVVLGTFQLSVPDTASVDTTYYLQVAEQSFRHSSSSDGSAGSLGVLSPFVLSNHYGTTPYGSEVHIPDDQRSFILQITSN